MNNTQPRPPRWNLVLVATGFLLVATFYSLSELHRISTEHTEELDKRHRFATDTGDHKFRRLWHKNLNAHETKQTEKEVASVSAQPTLPKVTPKKLGACYYYEHTDLWGTALNDGSQFKVDSAAECCKACDEAKAGAKHDVDCNVWVWCGDAVGCKHQYKECWLKRLHHPRIVAPRDTGSHVPWTSGSPGTLDLTDELASWRLKKEDDARRKNTPSSSRPKNHRKLEDVINLPDSTIDYIRQGVKEPRMFHTVTSASGTYTQWQTRIHYYHWRKMKALCIKQGFCEMGGFTRILHSGKPDGIMDEVPTIVTDPMPDSIIKHNDYVVLNRPYAFVVWSQIAKLPERYVLMAEPDHIILRPLPNFMRGDTPAAFTFSYIDPTSHESAPVIKRHTGITSSMQLEQVAPIGNSPTYMTFEDIKKVMPLWMNMSVAVYKDPAAKKAWGWVQEMYAFAMALYMAGIRDVDLYPHMMAQPPYDNQYELRPGRPFYILHYTYGLDFKKTGETLFDKVGEWHFDKREFDPTPVARNMSEPFDPVDNELARQLVRSFNEATAAIPCWEQYQRSRGADIQHDCGEEPGAFLATPDASLLHEVEMKRIKEWEASHPRSEAVAAAGAAARRRR